MKKSFKAPLLAITLMLCLSPTVFADTIRLKDGSVIRGQVIGFGDQQFTVLVGTGTRGRRSRITIYMEDVDSIEFDSISAELQQAAQTPDFIGVGFKPQKWRAAQGCEDGDVKAPRQNESRRLDVRHEFREVFK